MKAARDYLLYSIVGREKEKENLVLPLLLLRDIVFRFTRFVSLLCAGARW